MSLRRHLAICWYVAVCWIIAEAEMPQLPPPCSSEIYCHGLLLHTVQMATIYKDSKTFVDMKLKQSPNETLQRFDNFMKEHNNRPDKLAIRHFVEENFDKEGSEFEAWIPSDWCQKPKFLEKIKDESLQNWGYKLNKIWHQLGKKMTDDVKNNPDRYSIIWVPHPVIVPGGRFREFYYWDSYWIVQGLLLSEMTETAYGMLLNFLYVVDKIGFIPNGGRIYYTMRSQPPMLIPMVELYTQATGNRSLIENHIGTLEKEFEFWMKNRTVKVEVNDKEYTLAAYRDSSSGPRPESYREDVDTARIFDTDTKKQNFYNELKTAAESGWDFSSRWFVTNGTNKGNLTALNGRSIVPVELNAILHWNARLLAKYFAELGDHAKAQHYTEVAADWLQAVEEVLWHDAAGTWLDYDLMNHMHRDYFYPTNISPLWTGCYDPAKLRLIMPKVLKYLERAHLETHQGGVPTTHEHTGEQWDYPNAWPPLQHIMIKGLDATGDKSAQRLAYELARVWLRSNYKAFNETNAMFEKYDATQFGGYGGGGEYEIQLGFGWTNGIVLDLLDRYGSMLTLRDGFDAHLVEQEGEMQDDEQKLKAMKVAHRNGTSSSLAQSTTLLLALIASFFAGFIGIVIYKRRSAGAYVSLLSGKNRAGARIDGTSSSGGGGGSANRPHKGIRYTELKNLPRDMR